MSTTWTNIPHTNRAPRARAASVELPKPQPFTTPVLIGDCASPLAGETVLSLLWKRLDKAADVDQSDP